MASSFDYDKIIIGPEREELTVENMKNLFSRVVALEKASQSWLDKIVTLSAAVSALGSA